MASQDAGWKALDELSRENYREGVQTAKAFQRECMDNMPGGNAFTSATEAASGKEAITGRALSGTERGFRALEAGAGGLGGFAAATSDLARSGTKTRKALDNAAENVSSRFRLAPITGKAKQSWPRISAVTDDWATKGAHIHVKGIELAVRPGKDASVVFKPVFSSTNQSAFRDASKVATDALSDIGFRQRLHNAAVRALEQLGG
ncbi:hypothetical protein DTL42_19205 [Bremerella cremea]|uniref:Pre-toxin TG domain-containing protein n=1 Tax=Bremerella cremea TaxID=1031537 RepID=A0A368KME7_9BACT|nr:hypothetical protein [Bremerella cremea]RCS43283.1 hypothetical protein DTL42_19205 [Bremerella cremea]